MEAVRQGRRIEGARARHRRKDGSEVVAALTLTPLPGPDGGSAGALLVAENVGEQTRVREQLGEAEAKYRSLVGQLPVVVYVYPLGGARRRALRQPARRLPARVLRRRLAR